MIKKVCEKGVINLLTACKKKAEEDIKHYEKNNYLWKGTRHPVYTVSTVDYYSAKEWLRDFLPLYESIMIFASRKY